MKIAKALLFGAMALGALTVTGCKPVGTTTSPAALAPGYLNTQDQNMGEALNTAHGVVGGLLQQATSGSFVPSAAEKASINGLVVALNLADAAYQGYHAGTVSEASAATAVSTVQNQQQALQAQMAAGGK